MQVLMSDSLLSRVAPEEPTREKLLATFVFEDGENQVPITTVEWENGSISSFGLGFASIPLLSRVLNSENPVDVAIKDLDLYMENVLGSSYILAEHNNYSYELKINLEKEDG